jgi:hypothetical protein
MIDLFLVLLVSTAFYTLARTYKKNKWLFVFLGIGSYYLGIFTGAFFLQLLIELGVIQTAKKISGLLMGLMAMPLGVLSSWGLYWFLKERWSSIINVKNTHPAQKNNL